MRKVKFAQLVVYALLLVKRAKQIFQISIECPKVFDCYFSVYVPIETFLLCTNRHIEQGCGEGVAAVPKILSHFLDAGLQVLDAPDIVLVSSHGFPNTLIVIRVSQCIAPQFMMPG